MLTNRYLKSRFLACIAAAGLCLGAAGKTLGADCSCQVACDVCPTATSNYPCDCPRGKKKHNCLYRALDAFAGGIEKLLCLDRCHGSCNDALCDDSCDAAMVEELMLPMPPAEIHHHSHHESSSMEPLQPPIYSGETQDVQITPSGPTPWKSAEQEVGQPHRSEMRMTEPQIESLGSGQHSGGGAPMDQEVVPQPVDVLEPDMDIQRRPDPQLQPRTEPGSLFDTLSDPFRDDQTRTRTRTYQPVRPSSYDDVQLRPIRKRPLSRSYSESSRRVKNDR